MHNNRDPRKAFDWLGYNTLGALFRIKNATVTGHILNGIAFIINALAYYQGQNNLSKVGMMLAVTAWVAAWFHDGESMGPVPDAVWRIGVVIGTSASYAIWLIGG